MERGSGRCCVAGVAPTGTVPQRAGCSVLPAAVFVCTGCIMFRAVGLGLGAHFCQAASLAGRAGSRSGAAGMDLTPATVLERDSQRPGGHRVLFEAPQVTPVLAGGSFGSAQVKGGVTATRTGRATETPPPERRTACGLSSRTRKRRKKSEFNATNKTQEDAVQEKLSLLLSWVFLLDSHIGGRGGESTFYFQCHFFFLFFFSACRFTPPSCLCSRRAAPPQGNNKNHPVMIIPHVFRCTRAYADRIL